MNKKRGKEQNKNEQNQNQVSKFKTNWLNLAMCDDQSKTKQANQKAYLSTCFRIIKLILSLKLISITLPRGIFRFYSLDYNEN